MFSIVFLSPKGDILEIYVFVVIVKCLLSINTWEYFIAIDVYFVSKANSRMKIL